MSGRRLPGGVVPERPGPGQESVWDYPRPPRVESQRGRVVIEFGGEVLVDTTDALRVLETSHPPVLYVPMGRVRPGTLTATDRTSYCEFKGVATYLTVTVGERSGVDVAWTYPRPSPGYGILADHVAFYPGRMDRCLLGEEVVRPQPGEFYGGWVTSAVVGPFKGAQGTRGW